MHTVLFDCSHAYGNYYTLPTYFLWNSFLLKIYQYYDPFRIVICMQYILLRKGDG